MSYQVIHENCSANNQHGSEERGDDVEDLHYLKSFHDERHSSDGEICRHEKHRSEEDIFDLAHFLRSVESVSINSD